jgi:adenosine deaminase CECR1
MKYPLKIFRVWELFNRSVRTIRGMLCFETSFLNHFRNMLWAFARDGVLYSEIRFGLDRVFTIKSDDGSRSYGVLDIIGLLWKAHEEELAKIRASGLLFYGAKIIYACMRSGSREGMTWCMDTCIQAKQQFPDFICGKQTPPIPELVC